MQTKKNEKMAQTLSLNIQANKLPNICWIRFTESASKTDYILKN